MKTIDGVTLFKWFKTKALAEVFAQQLDSDRLISICYK